MSNKVSFIFKAIDQFTRVGAKIGKSISDNTKKFRKMRIESKKTSRVMQGVSKGITGAFGRMAAAAGGFFAIINAVKIGATFQDSMAELSAITGATGKDLEFMNDEILRMAKVSAISQEVVAKAFTDIASAKDELLKDPKALSRITEQALLLANAAGIDVPSAVQASVGSLNQFNKSADDAARFTNVLAAASKVGAAQVGDIVLSLKNAGTVAARFNVTFEETNALIQVLAKNGVKGAEAGTALRGTLVKLEKIAGGRFAPSKIGIVKSLEMIQKLGLSNTQIIKEFGEENLRSILILRDNIPLLNRYQKALQKGGVAQEQADKRLATFNAKLRKMSVTIKDSVIKAFIRLEPLLTKNVEAFTNWLDALDEEKINVFADSVGSIVKVFSQISKVVGFLIEQLSAVADLLGQVTAAVATMDFSQFEMNDKQRGMGEFLSKAPLPGPVGRLISSFFKHSPTPKTIEKTLNPDARLPNQDSLGQIDSSFESKSVADITVNIVAPEGTVKKVTKQTKSKGNMNIGVNMVTSPGI